MSPSYTEVLGTVLFALAVFHTFSIKYFQTHALKYPEGSVGSSLLHLLGEVEIVFGVWAGILVAGIAILESGAIAVHFVESANFTEPLFVFAIMTIAATRPVIDFATVLIEGISRIIPLPGRIPFYLITLVIGPLLGSFITEPAAMTVTAVMLRDRFFIAGATDRFRYVTLGILFVNVSIGGVLTSFAAPPVLMVANTWNWDFHFMFTHFGWKAVLAVLFNATLGIGVLHRELSARAPGGNTLARTVSPWWLRVVHLAFLSLVCLAMHHRPVFMGILLFFLGFTTITKQYQEGPELRSSLLVAFFLAGLVVFGPLQRWWLEPLIRNLDVLPLFLGTTALTAVTDNAALTFLGSQLPNLSDGFKYALVAGAVAGGGLTVIANAPNPAGFAILRDSFGPSGISPMKLVQAALVPTLVAMAFLWWLPVL